MTEPERIAALLPCDKGGTLRFWGQWFCRPHDNWHRIVSCEAVADELHVRFDEDELLRVAAPRNATVDARSFRIADAACVRWEWFYYGKPKLPENRCFEEFVNNDGRITATTNIDWYEPRFNTDANKPAVELYYVA